MIICFHMKYKYFSILFLAVLIGLGHITFSDSNSAANGASETWWMKNMPEASIIIDINSVQQDLSELSYSEQRFADMEATFRESRNLLSHNREELESYVAKIEKMQKDIEDNIRGSSEQKKQLEEEVALGQTELQYLRKRQEETKAYIRKMLVDEYKLHIEETADKSMYGLLFEKAFGTRISEKDTINSLENSATQLLSRQKSIEEELEKLKE